MKRYGLLCAFALPLLMTGCAVQHKLSVLRDGGHGAVLTLGRDYEVPELSLADAQPPADTLEVQDFDGRKVLIMKAVKDEDGDMVATDVIKAAYVTARFRNVAERHGKVDLRFQVRVPEEMQDSRWQLRFFPRLFVLEDSVALDPVVITGKDYRKAQLRGYQQYRRFLDSIITDSTKFISLGQLEVFLRRNIPQVFRFREDSSYVSDEEFASAFGVTEREAIDHYTLMFKVRRNERRKGMTDKMFHKYVKVPIVTDGLRLDTVMQAVNGEFIYEYVQTIQTMPRLKKAEITLSGSIFDEDREIYRVAEGEPLTFYISSLSSIVDGREKYLTKVTERRVEANTACYIDFDTGSDRIEPDRGENGGEIGRIEANLRALAENRDFDLDSIIVTASCSPEGSYDYNDRLSIRRSKSVAEYFGGFVRRFRDSLMRNTFAYNLDDSYGGAAWSPQPISFISRNTPENWRMLDALVDNDLSLSEEDKALYAGLKSVSDPDEREARLAALPCYRALRERLYPRLRTVRFDFHLHRKGMVKDTVHTTVLDTAYMRGVQAIRDRDYKTAVTILRPYNDYNAALAYCAMDYNASAMSILSTLDSTAPVEYMKAIVYSRQGDSREAVQHYLNACGMDRSYVHRGNLDPEISSLIQTYGLNRDD